MVETRRRRGEIRIFVARNDAADGGNSIPDAIVQAKRGSAADIGYAVHVVAKAGARVHFLDSAAFLGQLVGKLRICPSSLSGASGTGRMCETSSQRPIRVCDKPRTTFSRFLRIFSRHEDIRD